MILTYRYSGIIKFFNNCYNILTFHYRQVVDSSLSIKTIYEFFKIILLIDFKLINYL